MRIGIFTDTYFPDINGVATATKIQRDILLEQGNDVYVVTTGLKGQKEPSFEDGIIRIPGKPLKSLYNYRMSFFFNRFAYDILKAAKLDLIHVQQEFGISLFGRLCAKRFDIPLVYTCHTSYEDYTSYLSHGRKIPDKLAKKAVKAVIHHLGQAKGQIITPSLKSMRMLRKYNIDRHIAVIPNAVDFSRFLTPLLPEEKDDFLRKENLLGKKIVLWLGRLGKEKNLEESIDGFLAYKRDYGKEDVAMLVVGDGPDKEYFLKKYGESIGKDLLFLGKVEHDRTAFFYRIADVFLSSSTTETQGLTYSEAMACETLVLAKYDFNLERLIEDGVTGFLYDEKKNLAKKLDAIFSMTQEERDLIRRRGFNRCLLLFSRNSYYERLMNVYERALRENF